MLRALLPEELQAQVPCTPPRDRSPTVLWGAATGQVAGSERRQSLFHARARAALALPSAPSQITFPKVDLGALSADHGPISPISPLIPPVSSRAVSLPTVRGGEVSSATKAKLDDLATELGGSWRIVPPSPKHSPTQAPSAPSAPSSAHGTLSPSSTLAPPSVPSRDPAPPLPPAGGKQPPAGCSVVRPAAPSAAQPVGRSAAQGGRRPRA